MRIKALKEYYDTVEEKDVALGEIYETTDERGEYIIMHHYAELVEEIPVEEKPKKKTKKNAVPETVD